mgnify:CR=1 FL=1
MIRHRLVLTASAAAVASSCPLSMRTSLSICSLTPHNIAPLWPFPRLNTPLCMTLQDSRFWCE